MRLRLIDMQKEIKIRYDIELTEKGIWHILKRNKISWKTGRQRHPKTNLLIQEEFKKKLKI